MIDRIIFGDNQFFGINHMSEEKARALAEKFANLKAITDVIDIAYNCKIRGFMLNSNERAKDICDYLRENSSRYPDLRIYPSIPYPHKYANSVAEKGILATLKDTIVSGSSVRNIVGFLAKGGHSFLGKDMLKIMQILVDFEMKIYQGLDIKVIFLQNIVTDLLLGFGAKDILMGYAAYIKEKHGVEPGFITMNMPKLVDSLLDCGIDNPIVCFPFNKIGYAMNPNIPSHEEIIREKKFRPIAMSVLASGAVKPGDAIEYVCQQPNIKSIIFGASSRQHIEETRQLIETNMAKT